MVRAQYKFLIPLIAISIFFGCTTTGKKEAWIKDGENVGTILKEKTKEGEEWRYFSSEGILKHIEQRNSHGKILPGASVIKFKHNKMGDLEEIVHCNAVGNPAPCEEGYVFKTFAKKKKASGEEILTQSFLDEERKPVISDEKNCAFIKTVKEDSTADIKEVFLEDLNKEPAFGRWDGVNGVAHVRYIYLKGIGDMKCGVYYDPSGKVIKRKKLEGACSQTTKKHTTTMYYPGLTPVTTTTYH